MDFCPLTHSRENRRIRLNNRLAIATMAQHSERPYEVENVEIVADSDGLRVQIFTLAEGQCVPWHFHSVITDTFACLEGPMVIRTNDDIDAYRLNPGDTCEIKPLIAHRVSGEGDGPCKFLIVQGVGTYDYNPVEEPAEG